MRQKVLKFSKKQPEELTRVLWRGGATQTSPVTVRVSSKRRHKNTTSFWRGFLLCRTSTAWALLLCCAAARANFWLRTTSPAHTETFAQEHDRGIWRCFSQLLHVDPDSVPLSAAAAASLPLSLGRLGLRSAAHWASWADSLKMVFEPGQPRKRMLDRSRTEGVCSVSPFLLFLFLFHFSFCSVSVFVPKTFALNPAHPKP